MGVWIEIYQLNSGYQVLFSSLPSWECGLKSCYNDYNESTLYVTPLVGVWIEISITIISTFTRLVTPLVGVWIEIKM